MRPDPLIFESMSLEPDSGTLFLDGIQREILSRRPAMLLAAFMRTKGNFLSREASYEALYWNMAEADKPFSGAEIVQVCKLRPSVEELGYELKNHRGLGWRLQRKAQRSPKSRRELT